MDIGVPTAAHFIFIPVVLLIGVVIGWILGSRAAQDAFASELKRESGSSEASRERAEDQAARRSPLARRPTVRAPDVRPGLRQPFFEMRACAFAIGYSTR